MLTEDGTTQVVTITITGTERHRVITGDVTGDGDRGRRRRRRHARHPTDTGDLDHTDVDDAATPGWRSLAGTRRRRLRHLRADGGRACWTYTLDDTDPAVQALNGGATLTDTLHGRDRGRHRAARDDHHHRRQRRCRDHRRHDGEVTEAGGVANGTPGTPTDSGDLNCDRRRQSERRLAGGRGRRRERQRLRHLRADRGGRWTYTLDNTDAAVQALNGGATLTDSFTA